MYMLFFYFVLAVFHLTLKMWKIFDTENVIKDFVYIRSIYYYLFIYLFVRFLRKSCKISKI